MQDLHKIVLLSPMRKICTRFYLFPQCAICAQDLRKICARLYFFLECPIYAQDCTSFSNAQDLHKILLISPMCKICSRLYFFLQCVIYAQDCTFSNAQDLCKIVLLFAMGNICTRFYFSSQCTRPSHHLCTKHHSVCYKNFVFPYSIDRSNNIQQGEKKLNQM